MGQALSNDGFCLIIPGVRGYSLYCYPAYAVLHLSARRG